MGGRTLRCEGASVIGLVAAAAVQEPNTVAVTTSETALTYAELLADARRVAAALRDRGLTRFAVLEPDAARVLRLLAGAALAGAEPCLYQPDTPAEEFLEDAGRLGHETVLTRRTDLGRTTTTDPDSLLDADPAPGEPDPDSAQPLVIRTTGSTGRPKAVRHDWRVLERVVAGAEPRPGQRWLLAYGPQQFAGIQVLLHTAAVRGTLVAPFPRQPVDGLAAMLEPGVDCVSATPTYWRFLLAELRGRGVPAPPLAQITLGGEAASEDVLADLRRTFPDARITHVYASTEFGSVVAVTDGHAGFPATRLLSATNPDARLKVVDGELWVRARAGMQGYVGADDVDGAQWRATGDVVEVVGDRVHFRGRTTEVINVGGVKVSPLAVEERIGALDEVAMVRVFGRPNALTGAIVAAEVVPETGSGESDLAALEERIRVAVQELPPAWRPRRIRFVERIDTVGGKTVRSAAQ